MPGKVLTKKRGYNPQKFNKAAKAVKKTAKAEKRTAKAAKKREAKAKKKTAKLKKNLAKAEKKTAKAKNRFNRAKNKKRKVEKRKAEYNERKLEEAAALRAVEEDKAAKKKPVEEAAAKKAAEYNERKLEEAVEEDKAAKKKPVEEAAALKAANIKAINDGVVIKFRVRDDIESDELKIGKGSIVYANIIELHLEVFDPVQSIMLYTSLENLELLEIPEGDIRIVGDNDINLDKGKIVKIQISGNNNNKLYHTNFEGEDDHVKIENVDIDVDYDISFLKKKDIIDEIQGLYSEKYKYSIPCEVLYPYTQQQTDELSLSEGETVFVYFLLDKGGWCRCFTENGNDGWFPSNYLKVINPKVSLNNKYLVKDDMWDWRKTNQNEELQKHELPVHTVVHLEKINESGKNQNLVSYYIFNEGRALSSKDIDDSWLDKLKDYDPSTQTKKNQNIINIFEAEVQPEAIVQPEAVVQPAAVEFEGIVEDADENLDNWGDYNNLIGITYSVNQPQRSNDNSPYLVEEEEVKIIEIGKEGKIMAIKKNPDNDTISGIVITTLENLTMKRKDTNIHIAEKNFEILTKLLSDNSTPAQHSNQWTLNKGQVFRLTTLKNNKYKISFTVFNKPFVNYSFVINANQLQDIITDANELQKIIPKKAKKTKKKTVKFREIFKKSDVKEIKKLYPVGSLILVDNPEVISDHNVNITNYESFLGYEFMDNPDHNYLFVLLIPLKELRLYYKSTGNIVDNYYTLKRHPNNNVLYLTNGSANYDTNYSNVLSLINEIERGKFKGKRINPNKAKKAA